MSALLSWAAVNLPTFLSVLSRPCPAAAAPAEVRPAVYSAELLSDLSGERLAHTSVPSAHPVISMPVVLDLPHALSLSHTGPLEVPVRIQFNLGEARALAAQLVAAAGVVEAVRAPRDTRPGTLCSCTDGGRSQPLLACPVCHGNGAVCHVTGEVRR